MRHLVVADAEAVDEVFADRQTQRWLPLAEASGQIDGRAWCTELARQRLAGRPEHWMPASLVTSQLATLEEPVDGVQVDAALPVHEIVARVQQALGC